MAYCELKYNKYVRIIDREFEFYEFFSFLKFNEFYDFFSVERNSQNIVILQIIDVNLF